jgi:signal transduction histidine kinase/DNA-binding response OmpR family regulator/ligand-binding sensor domain-containing protein
MRLFIVIILVFAFTAVQSQNSHRFRHIDVNMGLAHTDATALAEDDLGFIWIGTNAGVQRFDGRQTRLFFNRTSKLNQVYNNRITALVASGEYLWVGSEGGLHCFSLKKEKHIPLKYTGLDFITEPAIVSRITIVNNMIWFISNQKLYVATFNDETNELRIVRLDTKIAGLPEWFRSAEMISVTTNNNGIVWVGTNRGIVSFSIKGNEISIHEVPGSIADGSTLVESRINHIRFHNQQLWVVSPNFLQILSLSNSDFKLRSILKTIDLKRIFKGTEFEDEPLILNNFMVDPNNNFWCASGSGLVFIQEPLGQNEKFQLFTHSQYNPFSISANNISAVLLDHSNCLWASTWSGGLSFLNLEQKQFSLLVKDPSRSGYSLTESFVRAIAEDDKGRIWLGGQNEGIDFYNPKTGECQPFQVGAVTNQSLTNTKIRAMKYHNKKMYIGTTNGLNVIDLVSNSIVTYPDIFGPGNPVYGIENDKFGRLWVGTWRGGLFRLSFQNNRLTRILQLSDHADSIWRLSSPQVNFVFADKEKNEILASTKNGLNRIILDESGEISNIVYYRGNDTEMSLSSEYIWPIEKQNDTIYWLGTLGGGLNKFILLNGWDSNKNGNYRAESFSVNEGAPSNDIESLLMDESGRLWIGSKGLSVFDPALNEFWNFDVNDGLQSNGFKIGSSLKAFDGTLFFGGIGGLNHFNPLEIRRNTIQPKVVLSGLSIRNQEIVPGQVLYKNVVLENGLNYTTELDLNYLENDFSLSFASLHYANPEKCSYKYFLEGYDREWHYISGDYPVASYSNLDYGDYTFIVDATNGDGLWSGQPVSLKIHINPPWWRSGIAYFIYSVLALALLYTLFFYVSRWIKMRHELKLIAAEEKKKEELHQLKLQFFMNISHEFKTPLSLIFAPLEKLKNKLLSEEEKEKMLHLISLNSNRMLTLINELMEFRKAEVGKLCIHATESDLSELVQKISHQFVPQAQKNGLELRINVADETKIWFDHEKMSTIIYNLLSNAINNTNEGGVVEVSVFTSAFNRLTHHYEHVFKVANETNAQEYVYIRVFDTGVGISQNSIDQIFERFYHMETSKNKHLGTGIGLALLKNLVLLHQGHVVVSSERFKGAEFLVGFPIGDAHLRPEEKGVLTADDSQIALSNYRLTELILVDQPDIVINEDESLPLLLLVEDNVELRAVLKEHYMNEYRVIEASDGKEALEKVNEEQVDLVISDIMMPEMDGLELVKELRQDLTTSHLPIALLTAKSSVEDQIAGTEAGADLYFPKPFNLQLMDIKLKQFLESRQKLKDKYASNVFADTRDIVRTQKDKLFIDKFVEIIESNIDNSDFSIDQLCLELNLGRTNLYKKIRSVTGQSIGEFIRGLRLKKAAKILLSEDISISEVLYRVGINSNSYFTKTFKIQFGMTPSEFLQQNNRREN